MCNSPDIVACKVYFPEDVQLQVHQMRTTLCPPGFHNGFYWYGKNQASPGHYPKWVENIGFDDNQDMDTLTVSEEDSTTDGMDTIPTPETETDITHVENEGRSYPAQRSLVMAVLNLPNLMMETLITLCNLFMTDVLILADMDFVTRFTDQRYTRLYDRSGRAPFKGGSDVTL